MRLYSFVLAASSLSADADKHWLAVSADRNKELQTCVDQMLGGKIEFSLTGVRTGNEICASIGESCLSVQDWGCVERGCDATSEGSRATQCDGKPGPPAPAPPPQPRPTSPTSHACLPGGAGAALPFCDSALPMEERIKDLISRMDASQKAKYLGDGATAGGGGIDELGIPPYSWNTEALHGLGAMCLNAPDGSERCPTVFPAPPGLGAAFNRSLAYVVGETIGTETRAMNNAGGCRNRGGSGCGWHNGNWYIGLNVWVPSLNIYRDPRWGRNVEVPSEDPYHGGEYGAALVRGVQGDDPHYTKISVQLKHFGFYSVEDGRNNKNFNISQHDVEDTYLPGFEKAIRQGKAQGYMCSYASVNGIPSCASRFLSSKARDEWGMEGIVQTDCGAIGGMTNDEVKYASSNEDAAAKGLKDGGVDISCGGTLPDNINSALAKGLVAVSDIDASLERSFGVLFRAGMFDPLEKQPYTKIPYTEIGAATSSGIALDAARQSLVLLKNDAPLAADGPTLPLHPGLRILVTGPHANNSATLAGNYFEDICPKSNTSCVPTVARSLAVADPSAHVFVESGCKDVGCSDTSGINTAAAAVADADVVVMVLGRASNSLTALGSDLAGWPPGREGEGNDVSDIRLPMGQLKLAKAIADAANGKPVVVVLVSGGLVAVEELKASVKVPAIVQAFYPGVAGGQGLAEALLGQHNRWSKLPFTFYAYNYTQSIDMDNMNMTDGVGRSYKYLNDPSLALWPFGWGLSYTTFSTARHGMRKHLALSAKQALTLEQFESFNKVSTKVTNTGKVPGDEVLFLFRTGPAGAPADPKATKELVGFERVSLAPGESKVVDFQLSIRSLSNVDALGTRLVRAGKHKMFVSRNGVDVDITWEVNVEDLARPLVLSSRHLDIVV